MSIKYKQRCARCKKNYVIATWRQRYTLCYNCQKNELQGEVKDKKMKKLLDIPEKYYMENAFLRDIKINYLRYGKLSEKQVEAFKKAVKRMAEPEKK
ncbi:hypothetical protein JXB11_02985 [Candidatus Woesearchaeota archaeon]|nr:hypothetical protein [Candidatus Woesearchaeota archaeon]